MDSPLVSIIVPIYNREKVLDRCIESILRQDFKNFELVLVDDGSKDGSPQICDDYAAKDSRVVVIHKENGGVSTARNAGIDSARGKYISFVDSDDWVSEDYLSTLVGIMDERTDMSVGKQEYKLKYNLDDIIHSELDDRGSLDVSEENAPLFADLLMNEMLSFVYCKLYRVELIKEHGLRFIIGKSFGEDVLFFMEYFKLCKRISYSKKNIYAYVRYGENTLSTSGGNHFHDRMELCEKIKETMIAKGLLNREMIQAIGARALYAAWREIVGRGRNLRIGWFEKRRVIRDVLNCPEVKSALEVGTLDVLPEKVARLYAIITENVDLIILKCTLMKLLNIIGVKTRY